MLCFNDEARGTIHHRAKTIVVTSRQSQQTQIRTGQSELKAET